MRDDRELLREYRTNGSEEAFRELVRRHVDLVYSTAVRRVGGDAHLARDVTQEVFISLARHAGALTDHPLLAGWLFTTARFAAAHVVRREQRRRNRERVVRDAECLDSFVSAGAVEQIALDREEQRVDRDRPAAPADFAVGRGSPSPWGRRTISTVMGAVMRIRLFGPEVGLRQPLVLRAVA